TPIARSTATRTAAPSLALTTTYPLTPSIFVLGRPAPSGRPAAAAKLRCPQEENWESAGSAGHTRRGDSRPRLRGRSLPDRCSAWLALASLMRPQKKPRRGAGARGSDQ